METPFISKIFLCLRDSYNKSDKTHHNEKLCVHTTYYTHQECSVLAKKKKKKNLAISQEEANFLSIVCAGVKEILNVIRVCNEGLCVNYS